MSSRSKGSVALARLGIVQSELARRLSVSTGIIAYWISGERKPRLPNRQLLLKMFGIPIESWDEAPVSEPAPDAKPSSQWGEFSVIARVQSLESLVDELMSEVKNDPESTPHERAKVMSSITHTLNSLRRLKGEDVAELRLTRHPKWLELKELLLDALDAHPEAFDAIIDAIEAFDARERKAG